uniref:Uncharacterized protein n=1 Tax=Salix viminalis TaxID=40686 RepID=A0A6N2LA83_SALVM
MQSEEEEEQKANKKVESHQFHPAIAPLIFQFFVAPLQGNSPDQTIIDANLEKLGKVLDLTYMKLS